MPSRKEGAGGRLRSRDDGLDRQRLVDAQRARMLLALAEVGVERGAPNVTVSDIVARSGVSRRTFYEQFADREQCFMAAFERALGRLAARMHSAYDAKVPWRERVREALVELLCFLDDEPYLGHLLVVQVMGAGPVVLARRQRALAALIVAVDEGRREAPPGHEPPPLVAEGVVGAAFSVVHARILAEGHPPLVGLTNEMMAMVVLPYLGAAAARRELARPLRVRDPQRTAGIGSLRGLDMRLTYRTIRVLVAIGESPGASNRQVAAGAGIADQGQVSKLLRRLQDLGLIRNETEITARRESNAWALTKRGAAVREGICGQASPPT